MEEAQEVLFFTEGLHYRVPRRRLLRRWLREVAQLEGQVLHSLRVVICSAAYVLDLNKRYLSHDEDTDILSFDCRAEGVLPIDGELYLSLPQVRKQAKGLGGSLFGELSYVMLHGVLHLCGYEDRKPAERKEMREAEARHMQLLKQWLKESEKGLNVSRETLQIC